MGLEVLLPTSDFYVFPYNRTYSCTCVVMSVGFPHIYRYSCTCMVMSVGFPHIYSYSFTCVVMSGFSTHLQLQLYLCGNVCGFSIILLSLSDRNFTPVKTGTVIVLCTSVLMCTNSTKKYGSYLRILVSRGVT